MTPTASTERLDALYHAVSRVDDAARLCGQTLDAVKAASLMAAGANTTDLDAAARLVAECRKKLQQAHTLIVGVALGK